MAVAVSEQGPPHRACCSPLGAGHDYRDGVAHRSEEAEPCPQCGHLAAVTRSNIGSWQKPVTRSDVVAFTCPSGCTYDDALELARAFPPRFGS